MDKTSLEVEKKNLYAILTAIDQALKNNVTQGSLSIAGRSVTYRSLDELVRLRKYILDEIYRTEQALKLANGESITLPNLKVRFK